MKLKYNSFNMAILVVNIPTSESIEDEINKFYGTLENATFRSKFQEVLLIIWNLNIKVKYEANWSSEMVDKWELGSQNMHRKMVSSVHNEVTSNNQSMILSRLWDWKSLGRDTKYLMVTSLKFSFAI